MTARVASRRAILASAALLVSLRLLVLVLTLITNGGPVG
jgi:hypothetical protein